MESVEDLTTKYDRILKGHTEYVQKSALTISRLRVQLENEKEKTRSAEAAIAHMTDCLNESKAKSESEIGKLRVELQALQIKTRNQEKEIAGLAAELFKRNHEVTGLNAQVVSLARDKQEDKALPDTHEITLPARDHFESFLTETAFHWYCAYKNSSETWPEGA